MLVEYRGKKYVLRPGTVVQVNWRPVFSTKEGPNWKHATINDILSVQFTAHINVDGDPLTYRFYKDVGHTWRPIDE